MFYNLKGLTVAALAFMITPALGQQLTFDCTTGQTAGSCGQTFFTTFCSSIANQVIPPGGSTQRCFTAGSGLKCDFRARNTDPVNSRNVTTQDCETALNVVNLVCAQGGSAQFIGKEFQFFGLPNEGVCRNECGN
ncbi:hypothetical protein DFH08DRAFT_161953 [Mycena albidolilacea]|uniref:Glycan binding protein Y3-like domain-containing protein n=1 Tax=Mycena albidolilacea TaxID=1033008 RepID=A0AAD7A2L0_9AGAR|nr:hypothetical protein DFH08DRAFT_161953 [Mycena albidolilacea]